MDKTGRWWEVSYAEVEEDVKLFGSLFLYTFGMVFLYFLTCLFIYFLFTTKEKLWNTLNTAPTVTHLLQNPKMSLNLSGPNKAVAVKILKVQDGIPPTGSMYARINSRTANSGVN
jgi:hypothetical protein